MLRQGEMFLVQGWTISHHSSEGLGAQIWNIRRHIMKEIHNTLCARHSSHCHTRALIESVYYCPHMYEDIGCYVRTCLVCQQDKVEQRQPGGLIEPLPIVECVITYCRMSMREYDYGLCHLFPKSEGYGTIMVIVDIFLKYASFMHATVGYTAKEVAKLFFKNVVKYWGLPRHIISDFDMLGTELHLSNSFHPKQVDR